MYANTEKGIFVRDDGKLSYAMEIVNGKKPWETRTKDMLGDLVGWRVNIIRTGNGKPMVVGSADVVAKFRTHARYLDDNRDKTLIPVGSKYYRRNSENWFVWVYVLENAVPCEPYPLPASAIRHGRSWCEF